MIVEEQEVRRGEIYHADLNPVFGSEQGGYRPVLIIQNNRGNQHSPTVIVAAITSQPKTKLPTHVPINGISGLEKESFVLLEQIRTVDKRRLDDYVGRLNRDQMNRVEKALRTSMEIKKLDKPVLMCLCPVCAKPFYNSKEHFIIRADRDQTIKETCMFCNVRQGYDYLIREENIIESFQYRRKVKVENEKILLNVEETANYLNLGKTKTRELMKENEKIFCCENWQP